ncbi:hypothetical protein FMEAI12_3640094 [Parafrankia sp. Ea1.12]|nr:hypothetical protein FMEAI12_3640094 [Parafrankia sp. Ea1.12]
MATLGSGSEYLSGIALGLPFNLLASRPPHPLGLF